MSAPTAGKLTQSQKRNSPPVLPEEKETPRAPKRIKLCLRAVVEALSKWRADAEDLVFSDDQDVQKRGGSADVAKATASIVKSAGLRDQSLAATHDVAVKKFRLSGDVNRRGQAAAFANELSLLSELDHDNIVKFVGFVESAEEDIAWVLMRWEENGNIREFIHSQDWVIPERLKLIYDVACGLNYLHSRDPPICHGDLKSLNILVDSQNNAVITDFGSARKLESGSRGGKENNVAGLATRGEDPSPLSQAQEQGTPLVQIEECGTFITLTGPVYTLRWAAPEVLRDEEFSLASDMWAFAWICWEIMTGSLPFNDLRKETDIILRVTRGNLPPVTSNEHISQVQVLCVMMSRCWRMVPSTRPAAKDCEGSIGSMDRLAPTRRLTGELESYSTEVLLALGYMKYENLQDKEANDYFIRALKVAESTGDAMATARAKVGQGTVCHRVGEYAEAEILYTAAREISESLGAEKDIADAMWGLGEVYRSWNKYSEAEASYNKAKEIYTSLGDEKKIADAAWGLGGTYRLRNEYLKAETSYTRAREIYARLGDERDVADAIWGLGEVYWSRDEYSKAEASYTKAQEIYERLGSEKDVADAIWGLGEVYRSRNEYSKAEASYTEARDIYARLGVKKSAADAIWGLGEVYRFRNEYCKAETSYTEAKKIYVRQGDEKGVADAIWALGDVYWSRDECCKAEVSYTEAKEIYVRLGAEKGVADANCGLGEVYLSKSEYCRAEMSYAEAREIYARLGVEKSVADATWGLGEAYRFRNKYSEAETSYIEAKEIYVRLGVETGVANAIWGLGEVYWWRKEYSKAETSYTEAKDIYARLDAKRNTADTILRLGEVYRLRKDYPKAKAAFIEAREIYTKAGYKEGVEDALSYIADLSEEEGWCTAGVGSTSKTSTEAEDEA